MVIGMVWQRERKCHLRLGEIRAKRDKYWLILLLCAMGRRQKDSKVVSMCVIKHKAVESWDGMGQPDVGGVQ